MTFPEACQYLDSFTNYEQQLHRLTAAAFTLDHFTDLLQKLGLPQKKFKVIHIAGTKGKGSTAALVAGILKQLGFRVGLYTSPHLLNIRERIRVLVPQTISSAKDPLADAISEDDFCNVLTSMSGVLTQAQAQAESSPTYFEVLTALAFCYFERQGVHYVVLETGLGGRLDATNVVESLVCGITPISLEHTQILGSTLAAIAKEKAGIIKASRPVVIAAQAPEALAVIQDRCREKGALALFVGQDILFESKAYSIQGQRIRIRTKRLTYEFETNFLGLHQAANAAMAVGLVEALPGIGEKIQPAAVVRAAAEWFLPGRFQILRREPTIILDVAHTPESVASVGETMQKIFTGKKVIAILGISRDKDKQGILQSLSSWTKGLILTRAQHPRSLDWQFENVPRKDVMKTKSVADALWLALTKAAKDDVILVTGSFFVVAETYEYVTRDLGLGIRRRDTSIE